MKILIYLFLLPLLLGAEEESSFVELKKISVEGSGENRKLFFYFLPEAPVYFMRHDPKKGITEFVWKNRSQQVFQQEYKGEAGDLQKIQVRTQSKNEKGKITVWSGAGYHPQLESQDARTLALAFPEVGGNKASAPRITLNVKNAPLAKVLRSVAAESKRSLIFGNEVSGNVSANVTNLEYEDAISNILRPTAYRAEHNGEVTIVRSDKAGKALRAFRANYIDVNQILKTVQDVISKDGQISVDTHTNTLFVMDRVDVLSNVESMIKILDHEPRQVEVEAAIVELDSSKSLEMGARLSGPFSGTEVSGNIRTENLSPIDPNLNSSKGMFVGLSWRSVQGILSILARNGKLSVIAKPRVVALNDQEASILIGSQIGYHTITVTQNGNVEDVKFLTVGTQLKIKPHITQSNDMLLYIRPEISDGSLDPTTRLPSTNTTSSETKVLAKDGQTIVIGGLLRDRLEKKVDKVPILGDIPILGLLFRGSSESMTKSEIVILLSPKIVDKNSSKVSEQLGNSILGRAAQDLELELSPAKGEVGR